MQLARAWHTVTAVVAVFALVMQMVLVFQGGVVLDETGEQPALGIRVARYFAYFTIQSNILVALTTTMLARNPDQDGIKWRSVRLAAVVGITVTGLVHFFLLRPLLDLDGADWFTDKLLHMVVPALALVGWLVFGPRPRIEWREVRRAICWPVVWLVFTLVVGRLSGWYPYPFLDPREPEGVTGVVVSCLGVTVLFLVLFWLARLWDRRANVAP